MAYILLNKDGSIPGYTKEEMAQSNEATPRENINHDKFKLSDEFYTKLDEESIKRIERRENKRKEDAKWMIYDKVPYSNQAVPTIGQSSKRGLVYQSMILWKDFFGDVLLILNILIIYKAEFGFYFDNQNIIKGTIISCSFYNGII